MTMKNDAKIEEELTCRFNVDMKNFTNFDPKTEKSEKIVLQSICCLSYITHKSYLYDLWFEKLLEKYGKFSPEYFVSNFGD